MGQHTGKVAVITGVARGQGRSHAIRLASEGADIVGVDICRDIPGCSYPLATEEDLAETVALVEKVGGRIVTQIADTREIKQMRSVAALALDEFGHIDIVLANAGIMSVGVDAGDDDALEEAWNAVVDVDMKGVWATVMACVPPMIERNEGGAIVLTSSTAGLKGMGVPGAVGQAEAYSAAKHGVVGLMRTFAAELAPHRIRVNTVHPTGTATGMVLNEAMQSYLAQFPQVGSTMENPMPVEMLQPEDVTDTVAWLVSDAARYVTGVALPVDAGFTVK